MATPGVVILGALLSIACSAVPPSGSHTDIPRVIAREDGARPMAYDQVIATDLTRVLVQTLDANTTTIDIESGKGDPILVAIAARLAAAGLGVRHVTEARGRHVLTHQRKSLPGHKNAREFVEQVTIGQIRVQRRYAVLPDKTIATAGPVSLHGTRTAIDNREAEPDQLLVASHAHRIVRYEHEPELRSSSTAERLVTRDVIERVSFGSNNQLGWQTLGARSGQWTSVTATETRTLEGSGAETQRGTETQTDKHPDSTEANNLFYGTGAFESVFDGLDQAHSQVVVFPNDSVRLGRDNKAVIARFLKRAVQTRDRIALVGCSNGTTRSPLGNEGLALGRAERVIDELLAHGIARERIHDEGCWAPVSAGDEFPKRGVLMSVWREPG